VRITAALGIPPIARARTTARGGEDKGKGIAGYANGRSGALEDMAAVRESYEVYYFQNGRWQLHGSYEAHERDKSIEECKVVESKTGFPTRLIRETFNPDTNTSEEVITWQSQKAKTINDADSMFGEKKKAAPKKRQPPPQAPRPAPAAPEPEQPKPKAAPPRPVRKAKKPKSKGKQRSGFVRFLIAVAISAGLGIVSIIVSSLVIAQAMSMGALKPANYTQLIIGGSVLIFFMALFINLQRQFNILALLRGNGKKKQAPVAGPAQMLAAAKQKAQPVQDVEFDVEIEDLRAKIEAEDAAAEDGQRAPEERELQELDADMGSEVHGIAPPAPPPEPVAPPQQQQQQQQQPQAPKAEAKAAPQPKPEDKKPAAPKTPEKSSAEIEARSSLGQFISETVRIAKPEPTNVFSKFGMNLYFAGGASVIGQAKRLSKDVQLSVLKDGLISAGNTAERAENFCVELPSHGKNPRYTMMIQAGAKAMTQHMGGASNATHEIGKLLTEWNLPDKRPTVPSVFTFVFTDIVGSTAMTQRLGNAGAQKAVRAHNTAVRGALQANRGREVKHTGDGIMAVFTDPVAAVRATIRMQQEIAAHNAANPNIEVMIRVGINVGEAVEEDNDFFGAAVQMTARICDKATKGNIWVSQAVMDAAKGQKIGFIPRGKFEMKGIQGSKPLYEIGWSDAHKNELADL
jgi:adenylate cyclase